MEIVIKESKTVCFNDLNPGECFVFGCEYFMKIFSDSLGENNNAVNIKTGNSRWFRNNLTVQSTKMIAEVVSDGD